MSESQQGPEICDVISTKPYYCGPVIVPTPPPPLPPQSEIDPHTGREYSMRTVFGFFSVP